MVNILEEIGKIREKHGYSQDDILKILHEHKEKVDEPIEEEPESEVIEEPAREEVEQNTEKDKPESEIDIEKKIADEVKRQLKIKRDAPPEMREQKEGEFFNNNKIKKNMFEIIV